jgi:hypothetical protein
MRIAQRMLDRGGGSVGSGSTCCGQRVLLAIVEGVIEKKFVLRTVRSTNSSGYLWIFCTSSSLCRYSLTTCLACNPRHAGLQRSPTASSAIPSNTMAG